MFVFSYFAMCGHVSLAQLFNIGLFDLSIQKLLIAIHVRVFHQGDPGSPRDLVGYASKFRLPKAKLKQQIVADPTLL